MGWLANIWTPENVAIQSWANFLSTSLGITILGILLAVIPWQLKRVILIRIVISEADRLLKLRRYWWINLIPAISIILVLNLCAGSYFISTLLSALVAIIEVTIAESIIILFSYWFVTQSMGPASFKYVPPLSLRLFFANTRRRSAHE